MVLSKSSCLYNCLGSQVIVLVCLGSQVKVLICLGCRVKVLVCLGSQVKVLVSLGSLVKVLVSLGYRVNVLVSLGSLVKVLVVWGHTGEFQVNIPSNFVQKHKKSITVQYFQTSRIFLPFSIAVIPFTGRILLPGAVWAV